MSVSSKSLQEQADELHALCPVLVPSVVPQGFDDEDLWGLAHAEGKSAREALKQQVAKLAKQERSCCICSSDGEPSTSGEAQEDESTTLRFTTFTKLNFAERSIHLHGCGFACGKCRGLRDTRAFIRMAALRLGEEHPEREQLVQELLIHFAATNRAPEAVQSNPEALASWAQELYSWAYSLQVVASNISGWQLVGPHGHKLPKPSEGSVVRLLAQLTSQQRSAAATPKDKKRKQSNGSDTPALAAPAKSPAAPAAQPPAKTPKQQQEKKHNTTKPALNGKGPAASATASDKQEGRSTQGAAVAGAKAGGKSKSSTAAAADKSQKVTAAEQDAELQPKKKKQKAGGMSGGKAVAILAAPVHAGGLNGHAKGKKSKKAV